MYLLHSGSNKRRLRSSVCASLVACSLLLYTPVAFAAPQNGKVPGARETASPIKHVIIIVGENRSFDHVYATYVPHNNGEKVNNLLSEGIVNADGTPGPNFAQAQQFQVTTAPNYGKYFINALDAEKTLYATLPPPISRELRPSQLFPSSFKFLAGILACPQPTNSCSAPAARASTFRLPSLDRIHASAM